MDPRRPKKSRSIGIESQASRPTSEDRPGLGERVHSAPSTAVRRSSHTKRPSEQAVRISGVVDRNSKASLRDDPFFRTYDSPQSVRLAELARRSPAATKSQDNTIRDGAIPQVNLVVLGARGVGKSTFVQNCFDMRQQPKSSFTVKKMSLDGVIYLVRLIEMTPEDIRIIDNRHIKWPKTLNDMRLPPIDGLLTLYDVMNQQSFDEVPEILHASYKSSLPCVLVSCKCDNPPPARKIEPGTLGQSGPFGRVDTCQTSANRPESQKRCISVLLRAILVKLQNAPRGQSPSRPRAATTPSEASPAGQEGSPEKPKSHNRAKSELTISGSKEAEVTAKTPKDPAETGKSEDDDEDSRAEVRPPLSVDTRISSEDNSTLSAHERPTSSEGLILDEALSPTETDGPRTPESRDTFHITSVLRPGTAETVDSQAHHTFLNLEEESEEESDRGGSTPGSPDVEKLKLLESPRRDAGYSFTELVDRLLSLPTSKHDAKFVPIFLCLYRKFATPKALLSSIITKFEQFETSKTTSASDGRLESGRELARVGEQLRYLQVLAQWTSEYPGDFAHSRTRKTIAEFLKKIESIKPFGAAAKEINNHLEPYTRDEDADWACCNEDADDNDEEEGHDEGEEDEEDQDEPVHFHKSDAYLRSMFTTIPPEESAKNSAESSLDDLAGSSPRYSGAPSNASSTTKTANTSDQSLAVPLTVMEARREASRLVPNPRTRLSKIQWHQFMETPDEDFAKELTRIDWIMYSAIRPRDFIRHVSLTGAKKDHLKRTGDINRMVDHFNHLALFVTGMILLRDKPKHRAKALEKFMGIAWKIRQQNNYNSLGSILAGINGTAIHRLAQTRELVPQNVQKEFLRLTILMGTMRSHATYRMAWENSFTERIPFLPLHLRDLGAAENGNRTLVGPAGDLINWKKFEIMGEVILGIQKSQERPYAFTQRNDEVARLVLETRILEGEEDSMDPRGELYERSVQLEPSGVGGEASRKKFEWFRR